MAVVPLVGLAGPPYITDDPEPTDPGHYETYFFAEGAFASNGRVARPVSTSITAPATTCN